MVSLRVSFSHSVVTGDKLFRFRRSCCNSPRAGCFSRNVHGIAPHNFSVYVARSLGSVWGLWSGLAKSASGPAGCPLGEFYGQLLLVSSQAHDLPQIALCAATAWERSISSHSADVLQFV